MRSVVFALMAHIRTARSAWRRRSWLFSALTPAKSATLLANVWAFLGRSERAASVPSVIKVDISPQCTLRCPVCLHAAPETFDKALLTAQRFTNQDRMSVDEFRRIIDAFHGRGLAVSMYYFGDPLIHPQLFELCRIARDGNFNVHLTTHFSYSYSDKKIAGLIESGVTHLTVAVDGASAEVYNRTRINGRFDWVVPNLMRSVSYRKAHNLAYPVIELQYVAHKHHPEGELERVKAIGAEAGVDHFTRIEPYPLDNVVDDDPDLYDIIEPLPAGVLPLCHWPFVSLIIKFDGGVVPCCNFRTGRQYSNHADAREAGNIFETPLEEIWNGEAYRQMRRLVSDPSAADRDPSLKSCFCYGCPALVKRELKDQGHAASKRTVPVAAQPDRAARLPAATNAPPA